MGKLFAILVASAAAAGGSAYAFFHFTNPYRCVAECETARMQCCAAPTAEGADACPTSEATPEVTVAAAGPVALFTTTTVPVSAELPCCAAARARAATVATTLTAAVGPAAAAR